MVWSIAMDLVFLCTERELLAAGWRVLLGVRLAFYSFEEDWIVLRVLLVS